MSVVYGGNVPQTGWINYGWIGQAWQLFIARASVWIVATLAISALPVVMVIIFYAMMWSTIYPNGVANPPRAGANPMLQPGNSGTIIVLELGIMLISVVYTSFFYAGLFRMAVQQVRGYAPTYADIFAGGPLFGRMLGAILLLGLAVYALEFVCFAPALLLLAIHGPQAVMIGAFVLAALAIVALVFVVYGQLLPLFALLADGVSLIPALRRSLGAMKGQWLQAAGFVFVIGLLIYASELPCLLGLLATIPMLFLISALVYRDMAGMPDVLLPQPMAYSAPAGVWPPPPGQDNNLPPV